MQWLKHAFAVDGPGPCEPNEVQRRVAERVCEEIVRRHLTTPSLVFFEMMTPLNFLSAQVLHFLGPVLSVLSRSGDIEVFAGFLEQRGSLDYLCRRIEELQAEAERQSDPQ